MFYNIHDEELFLFFMTRCKKSFSINEMVDKIFWGYCNRWSYGWPCMLKYIKHRYMNVLGHQGILQFCNQILQFFYAIEEYVKKPKLNTSQHGESWWSPGIDE
jgi:hypothetical protein